ncbi:MAG: class I SAM-dependent methyltransferase [Desulfotomaculaceae bacterium]|nr:class I SAM-dependent methyltransferase [Desulfotomaculaceae bacterium]
MSNKINFYKNKSLKYFDKRASDFFNTWDGRFCILMYEEVMRRIKAQPFQSILDIGCGTGAILSRALSEFAGIQACGIDLSRKMIEKAAEVLGPGVQLVVGDSDDLPWPHNFFDLVVCNSSFHHFPEPVKVLNEINRVLKPGGRIIIAEPWWSRPKRFFINMFLNSPFNYLGDVRIYSEAETRALLEGCGFASVGWELVDRKYFIAIALTKN